MRVRALIQGNDYTNYISNYEWIIETSDQDDIDVLRMDFEDADISGEIYDPIVGGFVLRQGRLDIKRGYNIIIESFSDSTIRYFGGIIVELDTREDGLDNLVSVTAQDWKMLLDRSSFSKKYTLKTDKQIIQDAFTVAKISEITTDLVQESRVMPFLEFAGHSLRSMLVTVSEVTNLKWWVDPFKRLHYEPEGVTQAAFRLSDNPDNVVSFPFYNTNYIEELGNFNEVEVRGGYRPSDEITETFSGNGTQKIWILGSDNNSSGDVSEPMELPPTREFIDAIDPNLDERLVVEKNTGTNLQPVWETVDVQPDNDNAIHGEVEWNPGFRRIEWRDPPVALTNSWRVSGRRFMPLIINYPDLSAQARAGRIFKHTIHDVNITTRQMGYDKALALIRENSDKERLSGSIQHEGLYTGETILVTSERYQMNNRPLKVHGMNIRLLGGDVAELRLTLGHGSHTLAHLMYALRKGRETPNLDQEAASAQVLSFTKV